MRQMSWWGVWIEVAGEAHLYVVWSHDHYDAVTRAQGRCARGGWRRIDMRVRSVIARYDLHSLSA